jgi:hypothetical protein
MFLEVHRQLATPLGKWTTTPHQIWHWFLDPISLTLYKEEKNNGPDANPSSDLIIELHEVSQKPYIN